MDWFDIDREGLAKILARRGKAFILTELIGNAWDTDAKIIDVKLQIAESLGDDNFVVEISVEDDDPVGFSNLAHAWTLFAESTRKADPTKAGRFNFGEKVVLACARKATIESVKGRVVFDEKGRRELKGKRKKGSRFVGEFEMTQQEIDEANALVRRLIPPQGRKTRFNGIEIEHRRKIATFKASLMTEVADDGGVLRRRPRVTEVDVYHPMDDGQVGCVYELGMPVVEVGDSFDVDVRQKVPQNLDRDGLPPAFVKALRVHLLNATVDIIDEEEVTEAWVREATSDPRCTAEAMKTAIEHRFGDKAFSVDPRDAEANKRAVSKGFTPVHSRSLTKGEWDNVKKHDLLPTAISVAPGVKDLDEESENEGQVIPFLELKTHLQHAVVYTERLAKSLIGERVHVRIVRSPRNADAWYGGRRLTFNLQKLGNAFFDVFDRGLDDREEMIEVHALIIHELGHEYSVDHLSSEYYDALCTLGAKMAVVPPPVFAGGLSGLVREKIEKEEKHSGRKTAKA